jgi:inorganic pyrophosphatase
MQDAEGNNCRIYRMNIKRRDYSSILGRQVSGTIDRPMGSAHPRHPDMIYPINYGYVDGVFAGDGAEQDVYVFGPSKPIRTFTGAVIAVLHRLNDCEDKWIVSTDGSRPGRDEILCTIAFQEQYFMGELYEGR